MILGCMFTTTPLDLWNQGTDKITGMGITQIGIGAMTCDEANIQATRAALSSAPR